MSKPKANRQVMGTKGLASSHAISLDPMLSAAWLYYEDQLTQSDIADVLGISRASVINYLHEVPSCRRSAAKR